MKNKSKGKFVHGRFRVFRPSKSEIEASRAMQAPLERDQSNGETVGTQQGFYAPDHSPIERGENQGISETARENEREKEH